MNIWRDIPCGRKPPLEINVVVEVPKGSRNKFEYDRSVDAFVLSRVLHSAVHFPADYGFIPQTYYEDDDPIDVVLLTEEPTFTGCVVPARAIGVMRMEDEKGRDDKILAVPLGEPRLNCYHDIHELPQHWLKEIKKFFEDYKELEGKKWSKVKKWMNAQEAGKIISHSIQLYKKTFK
jgi:inorganic pyrophosphatase